MASAPDVLRLNREEMVRRASALVPRLEERAARAEQLRRIPDETVRDLAGSGLLQLGNPARYGGDPNLDFDTTYPILWELARGCGSTGWCYAVWTVHNWVIGNYPEQAQEEYFATGPTTLCSSSYNPRGGRAEPVPGGYRLTGNWEFSSGCDAATWAMLGATTPGEPVWVLVPRSDYQILDTWHVSGLCGTGSKNIVVVDAFVPSHRTLELWKGGETNFTGWNLHHRDSYRVPMRVILGWELVAPLIGIGQSAVDEFIRRVRGTHGGSRSAERVQMQVRLSEAGVEVETARILYDTTVAGMMAKAARGESYPAVERARYERNKAYVVKLCIQAINRLFDVSGGHALFQSERMQRIHRDAHALSHRDGMILDLAGEAWGRAVLGVNETD